ncbi:MAG: DegT/DnrJ/EryC1/StrS family aminotransferase, partial [Magnetovibrio sp.]|nr:DegT/DnrJ/EryC1/StrS family aminotransferase [Magnetovibrio sp.]
QGPLATENGSFCGTIGHIGVFSLNYHKHIHTGEGGICATNDDTLGRRLKMIRNHAEAVVEAAEETDLTNMVGFNFRMTEMSAAVGLAQLENAEHHIGKREHVAHRLTAELSDLEGLHMPYVRPDCRHVYYLWYGTYDEKTTGVRREVFADALKAEGIPALQGYLRPLYRLAVFRNRIAIGRDGFPFTLSDRKYEDGLCPVAERLHEKTLLGVETCSYEMSDDVIDMYVQAFRKVHANLPALKRHQEAQG